MKINTKPEPKHVKNVPKNVSVILSICVHWSKGQILLIYPPTLSPKLLVWCFLKNVIKKKKEREKKEKSSSCKYQISQIPQNPYMALDRACLDVAKWNQTVYERTRGRQYG